MKEDNGMLQGVQAKVKNPRIKDIIRGGASNIVLFEDFLLLFCEETERYQFGIIGLCTLFSIKK